MSTPTTMAIEDRVRAAIATVDDPEYPGISIVDLGLLESIDVQPNGDVVVGLVPTFSGCPALAMIAADVRQAVAAVDDMAGPQTVEVRWLVSPAWTIDRVTTTPARPWPGSSPSPSGSDGTRCRVHVAGPTPLKTRCSVPADAGPYTCAGRVMKWWR